MAPHPDLLRTEFLGVTVRHEPTELPRDEVAALFASVSERHSLTTMEYHPDGGATFTGQNGAEMVLKPGLMESGAGTALGIHEGLERVGALLGDALERFSVGSLWIEELTLIAAWDLEDEEASRRLLAEDILRFDSERAELIGGDDLTVGLRLWRTLADGTIDCGIEPMHSDPSKLYLRLTYAQPEPVEGVGGVLACAEAVHEFLEGPVKAFVMALARS
jgi:hypothetical protein